MKVTSTKNRCRKRALPIALAMALVAGTPSPGLARPGGPGLEYQVRFQSRLAYHTVTPNDIASHRHTVELEQNARLGAKWSAVAGVRAYAESAFASNERYNAPVRQAESFEIVPRDLYVQFKSPKFQLRLGNQQVVWGEAFGFYYADIINPKDTREFGLGDLAQQRMQVPIANAVFFLDRGETPVSLQLVWIPKPYFNRVPAIGNDFAYPYGKFFPGLGVRVEDDRTVPFTLANGEGGGRIAALFQGIDLALFFFSYFDRSPTYRVDLSTGEAVFKAQHPRLATIGLTAAKDFGEWLIRFESIYTANRAVDTFRTDVPPTEAFTPGRANEATAVVGMDYTGLPAWRFGFQASHRAYLAPPPGTLARARTSLASVNIAGPAFGDQSFEAIVSLCPEDKSSVYQLSYLIPASSQFEIALGANLLEGPEDSQFGRFRRASRAFVLLKGYFSGT